MTRNLTSAVKNELATNDIRPVHLIHIGFSTPVYFTDCSFQLTSSVSGSSITYSPSDFYFGVSNFTEEVDITKSSMSLSLSGADQTFILTGRKQESFQKKTEVSHYMFLLRNMEILFFKKKIMKPLPSDYRISSTRL